jgi:molybdopterin/thiamine biosynthesis adenylyltransferase
MLTLDQAERYKRHLLLKEIGGQGQQRLLTSSVLVIGAGGIGCPLLSYLAAAGIGRIAICDGDRVALSNLQRQTLFTTADIGSSKAKAAARRLGPLNPDVNWSVHDEFLTGENARALLTGHDLVIEGLDRYAPRYILNEACLAAGIPLLSAAVGRFSGQVARFAPGGGEAPCYACYVPEAPEDEAACEAEGVLGATTGVIGALAAGEAGRVLCGEAMDGSLLLFDGLAGTMRRAKIRRDPACAVCGETR